MFHVKTHILTIKQLKRRIVALWQRDHKEPSGSPAARRADKMSSIRLSPGKSFKIADYQNLRPYQGIPNVYLEHPGNR
jgi:hypothetical protein